MKFLVDEDLPRSTSRMLKENGFEVFDVRDVGLRGASDSEVFDFAQSKKATLLTADLDFSNPLLFSARSSAGIVIIRLPADISIELMNKEILRALNSVSEEDVTNNVLIIEAGRIRLRVVK